MAGFGSSSEDDLISEINVTPLVDVILVLLIIFMVTAPVIYQSAIKVKLPSASSGSSTAKTQLVFSLSKDGKLSFDKEMLEWNSLDERLSKLKETDLNEMAIINADEATPHGTVVKLMDHLQKAGLSRFALNVDIRNN